MRNQKSEMSAIRRATGSGQAESLPRFVAAVQGVYYLITGIWPLLHLPSFEKVSGPKTDKWLVRTVGVLITVIGAVLCLAAARQEPLPEPEIPTLALGSAAGLTAIDVIYVAKGRISPIYLLDALLEIVLIATWLSSVERFSKSFQTIIERLSRNDFLTINGSIPGRTIFPRS